MKAIGYLKSLEIEHAESLMDIEIEKPTPSGRDLLVKIAAISVNPVDTKVRMRAEGVDGQHKILGWDAVGEVVAVGGDTQLFKVGDKVWYAGDITRSGSNAEYQLVDERIVGAKPQSLTYEQAAALPLTTITAYELLFSRLDFKPNDLSTYSKNDKNELGKPKPVLLIMGAAGGVGSILTQLARQLTDATVIGTASRTETQAWVKSLGAHHVINHHQPLQEQLKKLAIEEVTHVISLTHTDQHYDQLVSVLAPQGKLALIDDPVGGIDAMALKIKSISLHWELMFTRSMFTTWDMQKQHDLLSHVSQLIDKGMIKTTFGENYGKINAQNLKRAHAMLESNKAVGKVVLEGF